MTARVAVIAPAVGRMMAARPSAVSAQAHRTNPAASTAPATPGWARDTLRCWPDRIAWTSAKHPNASTSPITRAAAPTTAALPASTVQRCGTAAKVVRIRPLLYSEVNWSTASTLTGITVYSA